MNYLKQVLKLSFSLTLLAICLNHAKAQETLQQQYQKLIEDHETFERYKVIPKTTLDNFWSQVADSISRSSTTIRELRSKINTQQAEIDSLKVQLSGIQSELEKSKKLNDTIYFLAIPFTKLGYHILVWAIIVVLAVLALLVYFMYIRSNQVTSRSKKELEALKVEFETHKDKAREKQVKLKRELQTAVNTIDDLKRGRR